MKKRGLSSLSRSRKNSDFLARRIKSRFLQWIRRRSGVNRLQNTTALPLQLKKRATFGRKNRQVISAFFCFLYSFLGVNSEEHRKGKEKKEKNQYRQRYQDRRHLSPRTHAPYQSVSSRSRKCGAARSPNPKRPLKRSVLAAQQHEDFLLLPTPPPPLSTRPSSTPQGSQAGR